MKLSYLIVITFIVTFSCTIIAETDTLKSQSENAIPTNTDSTNATGDTNQSDNVTTDTNQPEVGDNRTDIAEDTADIGKENITDSSIIDKITTETVINEKEASSVTPGDTSNNKGESSITEKTTTNTPVTPLISKTLVSNKKDIKKLINLAMLPKGTSGTFVLEHSENKGEFRYSLLLNNTKKWGITLPGKNDQLEEILIRNKPTAEEGTSKETKGKGSPKSEKKDWHKKTNSHLPQKYGIAYHHTPWSKLEPFWKNDTLPRGLLSWFQWKSGGSLIMRRDQFYNFRNEGDTIDDDIDLMKTKLVGYNLEISYRHKIKFFWVGGGFSRHSQQASAFDTLFTENENWMRRLGWNIHLAVPGFKYELYRDPRLIPEFGCHDRAVFNNLIVQNAFKHEFLYKVEIHESTDTLGWKIDTMIVPIDTFFNGTFYKKGSHIYDSTALTRGIWIPPGVGHKFTAKVGLFHYSLYLDPYRYRGPIQSFLLKDLPFFKANWDMGMFILPNGRVIPTGAVDFYTFRIPIRGHGLHITPLRLTFQIASRREFYVGLAFKSEFLPDYSRKKKERQK